MDKFSVLLFLEPWISQAPSKKAGKKGAAATSKKGGAAGKVAKVRTLCPYAHRFSVHLCRLCRRTGRRVSRRSKSVYPT